MDIKAMLGAAQRLISQVLGLVLVMWLVATITFFILRVIPGDPVQIIGGLDVVDPVILAQMRADLGLDQPLYVQYFKWLGGLLRGDLGVSLRGQVSINELVGQALPVSVQLAFLGFLVGVFISIPAGAIAARSRGKLAGLFASGGALIGISLPSYVLALAGIYYFSVQLGWLPSSGFTKWSEDWVMNLKMMAMPAVTLGLLTAGTLTRLLRRSLIDQSRQDYVRTARSKGLGEGRIFYRHILRNGLIPYITVAGVEAGMMLSGSVITESIFAIPGIGRLLITNIYDRDYPVVQGVVFVVAGAYVLINFLIDQLYTWVDPRVSL